MQNSTKYLLLYYYILVALSLASREVNKIVFSQDMYEASLKCTIYYGQYFQYYPATGKDDIKYYRSSQLQVTGMAHSYNTNDQ